MVSQAQSTYEIDVSRDDLLTIKEAVAELHKRGLSVYHGSVRRWMLTGLDNGRRKLASCRLGNRLYTSVQAVDRFFVLDSETRSTNSMNKYKDRRRHLDEVNAKLRSRVL